MFQAGSSFRAHLSCRPPCLSSASRPWGSFCPGRAAEHGENELSLPPVQAQKCPRDLASVSAWLENPIRAFSSRWLPLGGPHFYGSQPGAGGGGDEGPAVGMRLPKTPGSAMAGWPTGLPTLVLHRGLVFGAVLLEGCIPPGTRSSHPWTPCLGGGAPSPFLFVLSSCCGRLLPPAGQERMAAAGLSWGDREGGKAVSRSRPPCLLPLPASHLLHLYRETAGGRG